jgi:hypothetical protein
VLRVDVGADNSPWRRHADLKARVARNAPVGAQLLEDGERAPRRLDIAEAADLDRVRRRAVAEAKPDQSLVRQPVVMRPTGPLHQFQLRHLREHRDLRHDPMLPRTWLPVGKPAQDIAGMLRCQLERGPGIRNVEASNEMSASHVTSRRIGGDPTMRE